MLQFWLLSMSHDMRFHVLLMFHFALYICLHYMHIWPNLSPAVVPELPPGPSEPGLSRLEDCCEAARVFVSRFL